MNDNPSTEAGARRVVVTGVGICVPGGVGREAAWARSQEGRSLEPSPLFGVVPSLEVRGFDANRVVDRRKALKLMGPNIRFALGASREAWEVSGRQPGHDDGAHAGIVLGARTRPTDFSEYVAVTRGSRSEAGEFSPQRFGVEGADSIFPLSMLRSLPNLVTAQVTIQLGLHGFSDSLTSGEVSGLQAVGEGTRVIRRGDAEVLLAGGADDLLDPVSAGRLLSRSAGRMPDLPISQGAAMLVLEERQGALEREARIFAEVLGSSEAFSAESDPELLAWTWIETLERASCPASAVAAIWIDGTLAQQEARLEAALAKFAEVTGIRPRCLSEARAVGDLGAASGAHEAALAVLSLHAGKLPGDGEPAVAVDPEAVMLVSSASYQGSVVTVALGAGRAA